jgi:trehalose 6-phosphate synthase/phosphatase
MALFHYFPSLAVYENEYWDNYKRVNEIFRDEMLKIIKPDDIIWIHDYHLMLLPQIERKGVKSYRVFSSYSFSGI